MRIVVHDYGGYTFTAQLARELAGRGHDVLYLHAGFRTPKADMRALPSDPPTLRMEGVELGQAFRGGASLGRLVQERRYGGAVVQQVLAHDPQVVISANCPLDAQATIQRATQRHGAAFVFWVQDIYAFAVGRLLARRSRLAGRLIGARYARMERRILRASDAVVAITDDFLPVLRDWSVPAERTTVVENWAPLDEVPPLAKSNAWSREHGLADERVLLYAGTLGRKHDPKLLLALATRLPDARVVVVAEGVGTEWLRQHGADARNLVLLPLQPPARVAEVLASADVLIALLEHDAGAFSVPSKVLTYLSAGRPILGAIPAENLAARTVVDAGAGRVVDPADVEGFVGAARSLLDDPDARTSAADAARAYAVGSFAIGPITDRFEGILRDAVRRSDARGKPALGTQGTFR